VIYKFVQWYLLRKLRRKGIKFFLLRRTEGEYLLELVLNGTVVTYTEVEFFGKGWWIAQ